MAVKGSFIDIPFFDFMVMMHLSHKTGRLEVTRGNQWAMIIFREGEVWHLEPRGFRGASKEQILELLMEWEDGNYVYQRVQVLPALERTVNLDITEIMAARLQPVVEPEPEFSFFSSETDVRQLLCLCDDAESRTHLLPQNAKRIVQTIDGTQTMEEVIAQSQLDADDARQTIDDLIAQQILQLVDLPDDAA